MIVRRVKVTYGIESADMATKMALWRSPVEVRPAVATLAGAVALVLAVACTARDRPSPTSQPLYALGVATGDCPPDVAFYHAAPPGARVRLAVVATPVQVVTYTVISVDPEYDGLSETVTVPLHANGHTFTLKVPMSAITAISVSANGSHGEQPSTCTAVRL
jgi:hypothetical protein